MADVGRPTDLTDKLIAEIRQSVFDNKTLKDFAKEREISYSTLTDWTYRNYRNLSDKIRVWKLEAKLKKAEDRADEILALPLQDKENKIDPAVLRTVQKEAEFIRKTLAKETYSERQELTGKDGKDLPTPILTLSNVSRNDSNTEDNIITEEN